ncbi:MAG: ABC transporter permease subunit, partial [Planctomycetes bacterium]|nr:ABC transporter permease subunit [Planctomycetota bacterium]
MSNWRRQLIIILIITWLWFLLAESEILPALLFPPPQKILSAFWHFFVNRTILSDIGATFMRLFVGLSIGSLLGILIGFSTLKSKEKNGLIFWIDFLRSIPAAVLLPIFLLLLGLGEISKIALVIFSVTLIMSINTIYGIKSINNIRLMVAKNLLLNTWQTFTKVIFPEALPHISSGLRQSISFSLIIVVVIEMLVSTEYGLGRRVVDYHLTFEISSMYAVIILIGIIGY